MRNDLLEQIVIASGGTVTNKDDRNALLSDWLSAVESPQIEVARLDGATQYWLLESPIEIIAGDEILHEFRKSNNSNNTRQSLTGLTDNFTALVLLNNDRTYLPSRGDFFVDNQLVGSSDSYPTDTLLHETRLVSNTGFLLETLGANWTTRNEGVTRHFDGVISSFKVKRNGVLIHEIPLTNKAQGATQLATVGSVNATMINYTPDVWEPSP